MRCTTQLAVTTVVGLLIAVPLDAAPRHLEPLPVQRPPHGIIDARSSTPPVSASQNRDQKQGSRTDDSARDEEACLARLRAAEVQFDIPLMPVATKSSCAIEVPVRLNRLRRKRGRSPRSIWRKSPSSPASLLSDSRRGSATWSPH